MEEQNKKVKDPSDTLTGSYRFKSFDELRREALGIPTVEVEEPLSLPTQTVDLPSLSQTPPLDPAFEQEKSSEAIARAIMQQANEEDIATSTKVFGTIAGIGTEIGGGIAGSRWLLRYGPTALKALRATRVASLAGFAGPQAVEPTSTVLGVLGFAVSEAGIWGLSNLLGQGVEMGIGSKQEISAGELVASSLFGVSKITKTVDGLIVLGTAGKDAQKAYKAGQYILNNKQAFVSGAALGLAESALRQEVEAQMNGTDREIWDYIISANLGGSLSTGIEAIARSGKWGRNKVKESAESAVTKLKEQISTVDEELASLSTPELKDKRSTAQKERELTKKKKELEQSVEIINEVASQIDNANKLIDENIKNRPSEEDLIKRTEESRKRVEEKLEESKPLDELEPDDDDDTDFWANYELPELPPKPVEPPKQIDETKLPPNPSFKTRSATEEELNSIVSKIKSLAKPLPKGTPYKYYLYLGDDDEVLKYKRIDKLIQDLRATEAEWKFVDINTTLGGQVRVDVAGSTELNELSNAYYKAKEEAEDKLAREQSEYYSDLEDYEYALKEHKELESKIEESKKKREKRKAEKTKKDVPPPTDTPPPSSTSKDLEQLSIIDKWESVLNSADATNITTVWPNLSKEVSQFKDSIGENIRYGVQRLVENVNDKEATNLLLQNVRILREVNRRVADKMDTLGGRLLQSKVQANESYYESILSYRSAIEDEALFNLEQTLAGKLKKNVEENPDFEFDNWFDNWMGIRPTREDRFALLDEFTPIQINGKEVFKDIDEELNATDETFTNALSEGDISPDETDEIQRKLGQLNRLRMQEARRIIRSLEGGDKLAEDELSKEASKLLATGKKKSKELLNLEAKIKFYRNKDKEAVEITRLEAKRDQYLKDLDTDDIKALKEKYPETPDWVNSEEVTSYKQDLRKLVNGLRKEVKDKIKKYDDDLAKRDVDPETVASEKLEKEIATLEKSLEQERKKYISEEKPKKFIGEEPKASEEPPTKKEKTKKEKEDPKILELKIKIKFYKDAVRKAKEVESKTAELKSLLNLKEHGSLEDIEKAFPTKGTKNIPPKEMKRVQELKDDISKIKKELKDRLKERDKNRDEAFKSRVYSDIEKFLTKSVERDSVSLILSELNSARKLSMIDQLPSVLAGAATGAGIIATTPLRAVARIFNSTTAYDPSKRLNFSERINMGLLELQGLVTMFTDWEGTGKAVWRTAKTFQSTTDRAGANKMFDDGMNPTSLASTVSRASRVSKRKARKAASESVGEYIQNTPITKYVYDMLSLGGRGIMAVDELFKRQILKGRLMTKAKQTAYLDSISPNSDLKGEMVDMYAEQYYRSHWEDADGVEVLRAFNTSEDTVSYVREALLFAARDEKMEDVYENIADKVVRQVNSFNYTDDKVLRSLIDMVLPFFSVATRATFKSVTYATAPLSFITRKAFNPYKAIVSKLEKKLAEADNTLNALILREQEGVEGVIESQAQTLNASDFRVESRTEPISSAMERQTVYQREAYIAKRDLLIRRIERAKERKVNYDFENLSDFVTASSFFALGTTFGFTGAITGSMSFLDKEQKEKLKGIEPFRVNGIGNSDYSAAVPYALPISLAADIGLWLRLKQEGFLKPKQDLTYTIFSSLGKTILESPLIAGVENVKDVLAPTQEVSQTTAIARIVASYSFVPAELRKSIQWIDEGKKVSDLKGASFQDRVLYSAFGVTPTNKKTDRFGEDIISDKNILTQLVSRQAPRIPEKLSEFDKILSSDVHNVIKGKPVEFAYGINMTDFVDEEGRSLSYEFDQRLKSMTLMFRGKKRTLREAIDVYINSRDFKRDYQYSETLDSPDMEGLYGRQQNLGLAEINSIFKDYYSEVKQQMLDDEETMKRFVNNKDEVLFDLLEGLQGRKQIERTGTPTKMIEIFNR